MGLKEAGLRGSLRSLSTDVTIIPDSGLLHSWTVSDTTGPIIDQEGTKDLSVVGGSFDETTAAWKDGVAFEADGTDDRAEADSTIVQDSFTVCQWVYPRTLEPTVQNILTNGTGPNHFPRLRIADSDEFEVSLNGSFDFERSTGGPVDIDTLQLVSGRYDGSTLELVKNTTQVASTSVSETSEVSDVFTWADEFGGSDFPYDGFLDWGLFYNRRLDDSEIQQIFDAHPST